MIISNILIIFYTINNQYITIIEKNKYHKLTLCYFLLELHIKIYITWKFHAFLLLVTSTFTLICTFLLFSIQQYQKASREVSFNGVCNG